MHKLAETKEDVRRKRMNRSNQGKSDDDSSSSSESDSDISLKGEKVVVGDFEVRKDSLSIIMLLALILYEVFEE
jgi:hypothetical protein